MKYVIIYAIARVLQVDCPDTQHGNKKCTTVVIDSVPKEFHGNRQAAIAYYNQIANKIDTLPGKNAKPNTQNITFVRIDSTMEGPSRKFFLPAQKQRLN